MNRRRATTYYFSFYALSFLIMLGVHYWLVILELNNYEQQKSGELFDDIVEKLSSSGNVPKEKHINKNRPNIDLIIENHPALARYHYQIILKGPYKKSHIRDHLIEDTDSEDLKFGLPKSLGYGSNDSFEVDSNSHFYHNGNKLNGWIKLPDNYRLHITLIHVNPKLDTSSIRFWAPLLLVLVLIFSAYYFLLNRLHLWHLLLEYANNISRPDKKSHLYNTYESLDYEQKSVGQEFARIGHAISRANYRLHDDRRKTEILKLRIERLLTHAPLPIAYISTSGRLSHINERFSYVFRLSLQRAEEICIQEIVSGIQEQDKTVLNSLAEQKITRTIRVTDQDGHIYQLHIMPWFAKHGKVQGYTVMLNNISQISNKLDETLIEMNQKTARLADFDKLWSVLGHELRTPLSGIIGMIDLIKDTNLNQEQRETFETLEQTSQSMLFMLNDMLDLAKLEAGKLQLNIEKTDLLQMSRQICDLMVGNARKQNIELLLNYNPTSARYINTDEARLRQVLLNLMGNAIKFTQSGFVALRLSMKSQQEIDEAKPKEESVEETAKKVKKNNPIDPNQLYMCFEITDTGIGISKEEQGKLFSFFNQANNTISKTFGGTGLGLAISKNFTEMMGGEIILTSEPNVGSKFEVRIPIDKHYEQPVYQFNGDFSNICFIAITNIESKAEHLKELCYYLNIPSIITVGINKNSINEINQQLKISKMKCLTKILLIEHPVLMEYEDRSHLEVKDLIDNATDSLINKGSFNLLPAILSELTDYETIQKLLLSIMPERSISSRLLEEFDGFIASPLDVSYLISELLRLSQKNEEAGSFGVSKLQYSFNNFLAEFDTGDDSIKTNTNALKDFTGDLTNQPTILVAEDNKVNQKVATKLLNKIGYNALIANNGQEALDLLAIHHSDILMILMDCRMPVMDGLKATRHIRSEADSIPIIALTANDTDEDRNICLRAGMDNFMSKPLKRDVLEVMLKKYTI